MLPAKDGEGVHVTTDLVGDVTKHIDQLP